MTRTPNKIKSKNLINSESEETCSWKNCWYPITFIQDFPNNRPYGFTLHDEPFVLLKNKEGKFICYLLSLYKNKKITHSVSVKSFPVAKKQGMIWFWRGKTEEADENLLDAMTNFYNPGEEHEKIPNYKQ